jgi:hypothetical protein
LHLQLDHGPTNPPTYQHDTLSQSDVGCDRRPSFHPLDSIAARLAEAKELHGATRFNRYHAHAAPQMYGGQVPVFGHTNPGYGSAEATVLLRG